MKSESNLIWIDLEMTGLDHKTDQILEIASVVTDAELRVLAEGPVIAIQTEQRYLDGMDEWCTTHHGNSGLTKRVQDSKISMAQAEQMTMEFLKDWLPKGKSPMCGNSICQDRRFMIEQMPELESFFHYRNLDVSTLKELARRWIPQVYSSHKKKGAHLALDDIYESIDELKHYRKHMFIEEARGAE
ncbi:oligoribonuclease [Hydrogenovibrio marinus]|uniref:Oligoribonuclease n=1 Tax=Hydrogenovibrio marinus TaxID=28885 RepID=A0A066ZPZ5_HYDMR|nr:oligoribonuclease [Hydrogenovibrio marinus]KDN95577.1 oligoribonuclease [Hydrogenovibrio marinus]BBN60071.1 oligoribonuclease [Hydrogenovibrio marinus]